MRLPMQASGYHLFTEQPDPKDTFWKDVPFGFNWLDAAQLAALLPERHKFAVG